MKLELIIFQNLKLHTGIITAAIVTESAVLLFGSNSDRNCDVTCLNLF